MYLTCIRSLQLAGGQMITKQKAIIVESDMLGNLMELNGYLSEGWKVVQTCPMPSSIGDKIMQHPPTCMVIIEQYE